MSKPVSLLLNALGGATIAATSAVTIGRIAFKRKVAREVAELFEGSSARPSVVVDANIAGLPAPVQRWLRNAGVVGKERPANVRLKQEGLFRQGEGQKWMPFRAEEYYTTDPPGFIWSATMRVAPLLSIVGRDKYHGGRGSMQFRLLSLIPVANASGPELDQGALLRYLNETMWFPAAALNPYITWEWIDSNSAQATMRYQGVQAAATFFFSDEGDLTNMVAQRYRLAPEGSVLDTWSTPLGEYGEFNGIRVPVAGEAVWNLASGDFSYIRLRLTEIEYDQPTMY